MKSMVRHWMTAMVCAGFAVSLVQTLAGEGSGAVAQQASLTDNPAQAATLQLIPAVAELNKTLDAKKAKQGDVVAAKLQQDVKEVNGRELPKDTVLEGHVDQVQASQNKGGSTLVITFDKAKLKSGEELPIKATVLSIAQPVDMMQQQLGGSMPSSGGAPMSSGGGGRSMGGAPMQQSRSQSASTSANGGQQPGQQQDGGQQPGQQQDGGQQPGQQQDGVPGVTLQSDVHQAVSATFKSSGKNVQLLDGTRMRIAVAVIPAGATLQ